MISFEEAHKKVMEKLLSFEEENVFFTNSLGRILAEDILADRDFPPFHRATKDGIAINYGAGENTKKQFKIQGIIAAGTPKVKLNNTNDCLEIMTGAVLPENADTVVMYEDITIENGSAIVNSEIKKGQNIHRQGTDVEQGAVVIKKNTKITAAEIGILASVGKVEVKVKKLPKIALISTGNELVAVHETPKPHQIRNSNMLSLHALLEEENILATHVHLNDDKEEIKNGLNELLRTNNVLMLSGGVSKGKFDFIPEAFEELGVEKIFHRVAQRPGKPFWFGIHKETNTVVFSFPGNPVSTFANYYVYFKDWLYESLRIENKKENIVLGEDFFNHTKLTLFVRVKIESKNGITYAFPIKENGSGDLMSLAHTDGFIALSPNKELYKKEEVAPFIATR